MNFPSRHFRSIIDAVREFRALQHQRLEARSLNRALASVARFPQAAEHRRSHGLPGELVLSLTSFPQRFNVLPLTLKSLFDQTVTPDRIVLWIADGDWDELTDEIRAFERLGLEIRRCEDLRSYKKMIPALEQWPDAFIVTADDDLFYPSDWLAALTTAVMPGSLEVLCRRAHRPLRDAEGRMLPYMEWKANVVTPSHKSSIDRIFPTTGAGALFPPGLLPPKTVDRATFSKLAPTGDDLWLYWMARSVGASFRRVGSPFELIYWPGSQEISLFSDNAAGRNDEQIKALEAKIGLA